LDWVEDQRHSKDRKAERDGAMFYSPPANSRGKGNRRRQRIQILNTGKTLNSETTPHTEAVHHEEVLLGVLYPWVWPLKAPGCTLSWRVAKLLVSPLTPVNCIITR